MKAPQQNDIRAVVDHAETIQGWMTRGELAQLFEWAGDMDSIVELGSWKGRSTYALAKGTRGPVTCIDKFKGSAGDVGHARLVAESGGSTLGEFLRNVEDCGNVRPFICDTAEAAAAVADVDMVFVDAGHSYAEVVADLRAWAPKARKLICGHDYQSPDVRRAIDEVLGDVHTSAGGLWFKRVQAPRFSILHTSARPDKWRAVYDDWMRNAARPDEVEYVLCVDPRWGFSLDPAHYETPLDNVRVVVNNRRRCYVDGVNLAAEASTGQVLIVNADDQFSCVGWDTDLGALAGALAGSFVIEVTTGTPSEHERGIMVMPILSRARYQSQGFVFYPEYESMFADNDFCEVARRDGVVLDARDMVFPHRHALIADDGGMRKEWPADTDAAYKAQNRPEAYALGQEVYGRRKAAGFPVLNVPVHTARSIVLCFSGERFEGPFFDAALGLQGYLIRAGYEVIPLRAENNIVHLMREDTRKALAAMDPRPDLVLWLDDDNTLTPNLFERLLADLDAHPEFDGIFGWCWIHNREKKGFMPSCGEWAPDHLHWNPFPPSLVHEQSLRPFDTGGFPCALMRWSALEKAGEGCFLPIMDNRLLHGMSGEDMAFFWHAEKHGARFAVDPQVRVPHLKLVEVEPVFPDEGKTPVKVACMIRARNEGRWIGRVIESVKPLCGDLIFLMEDGSSDDTRAIAEAAGAVVLESPFVGQGLDERRDKNWLLDEVKARCSPDWIFMPDGDEELEPGGCEKIRRTLESNPPIDCFSLRILNLWDSVRTVRLDGVYGTMCRQSLFRANSDLRFKSYYEGEGENHNHVGLHTSNAPGLGGNRARISPLNVFLLHYGPLHRADRIRKYRWITALDPHNEAEGFYLHMVQGDLPEVPADMKLKHSGPLQVAELPARLVPDFDGAAPWLAELVGSGD
jgi:hypothetical protein